MERKFQLIDTAYGFLTRHRATVSARNVVQMANSFNAGEVTLADLRRMAAIAPELLALHATQQKQLQHRDDVFRERPPTQEELEILSFPTVPQISQRASATRMKLFAAALKAADPQLLQDPPVSEIAISDEAKTATDAKPPSPSASSGSATENEAATEPLPPRIELLKSLDIYQDQIVHVERRPARAAIYESIESLDLPPAVVSALASIGIQQLYSHQHAAIRSTLQGDNVVLSTSTASGKSLTFNVPTLTSLVHDPGSTFLYLFPTKALAQDQLKSLRRFLHAAGLPQHLCATFDGDTPMKARSMVVRDTKIFLTNPDIMHLTILPKHTQWKSVLANLKLLVVDEAHMYRGVFGAHVANVFRRLFRLCALYGSNPRVVCCSATIRNPAEHFRMLVPTLPPRDAENKPVQFDFFYSRPLQVITEDGAPTAEKLFCLWNPLVHKYSEASRATALHPPPTRKRKRAKGATESQPPSTDDPAPTVAASDDDKKRSSSSSIFQSAKIFSRLVQEDVHTLLFCKGRKLSELVLMSVHSVLKEAESTKHLVHRVHTYRGGYSAEDRRRIERRLFHGELLGVIATNALELGIDIGELDCTMHLGLPGSISSLWQQAGRAGRKHTHASLAVVVFFDAPLDQHFARHPTDLFQLTPEAVSLNADNTKILAPHLLCAAHEYALFDARSGLGYIDSFVYGSIDDTTLPASGETRQAMVKRLLRTHAEQQQLFARTEADGGGYRLHSCSTKSHRSLNLRSISEINYKVVTDDDELLVLDEIPGELVFFQVYPTAVYLHQAQEYVITRLDIAQKLAFARRCPQPLTYYTSCRDYTEVDVVKIQSRTKMETQGEPMYVCEGDVAVTTSVFGSTMMEKKTMRVIHANEFSLPPMQSFGHALWLELPRELRVQVEQAGFVWIGALHGVGHLLMAVIPLFVLCDAGDINTEHYNPLEKRIRPNRVTMYERREGGSGIVEEIAKCLREIVRRAWVIANECACVSGCPSCVHSAQCTEYNKVLDKRGSLMVLDLLAKTYQVEGLATEEEVSQAKEVGYGL